MSHHLTIRNVQVRPRRLISRTAIFAFTYSM